FRSGYRNRELSNAGPDAQNRDGSGIAMDRSGMRNRYRRNAPVTVWPFAWRTSSNRLRVRGSPAPFRNYGATGGRLSGNARKRMEVSMAAGSRGWQTQHPR